MMELGFVTVTTGVRTVGRDWSGVTLLVRPHRATARWLRFGGFAARLGGRDGVEH
jgi:hypothetical protein